MSQDKKIEIVKNGVKEMAFIERNLDKAATGAEALAEVIEKGVEAGMVKGYLEQQRIIREAKSLAGSINALNCMVFQLHQQYTKISIENGADSALPTPGADGVTIMSGGDR